jgi:type IV secretion system protein VirB9
MLLLTTFLALSAATVPRAGTADPHIQSVVYDPDEVIALKGALGWQIMIEFGADERIENVSIGDSLAWQVTPNKRAKMLFLKPLLRNGNTNMTVVTSQRRYAFDLSAGPRTSHTPWVLRFDYPAPVVEQLPPPPPPAPVKLNFGYVRSGYSGIMPTRVWDDGRQTYFEFAAETPIPAIFAAGPGKKDESLVNVATRGRVQVVQQTGPRFILRAGSHFVTVTRTAEQ